MKVYILDNGWLECDRNWMVAMSVFGTREDPNPPARWVRIPVYAVLIDHPGGKILFDAGCHPDAMKGRWPPGLQSTFPYYYHEHQDFRRQLSLAGAAPEEIHKVVLSHLHADHAGNIHLFPHAQVYIHPKELERAHELISRSSDPDQHDGNIREDVEAADRQRHLVEADQDIAEGVRIITLPGHTPGILGLVVHLKEAGTLIFPADAVYAAENYGPPARPPGAVYDTIAFAGSVEKVRSYERRYHARLMFPHDMEFFHTMRLAPECYE